MICLRYWTIQRGPLLTSWSGKLINEQEREGDLRCPAAVLGLKVLRRQPKNQHNRDWCFPVHCSKCDYESGKQLQQNSADSFLSVKLLYIRQQTTSPTKLHDDLIIKIQNKKNLWSIWQDWCVRIMATLDYSWVCTTSIVFKCIEKYSSRSRFSESYLTVIQPHWFEWRLLVMEVSGQLSLITSKPYTHHWREICRLAGSDMHVLP